MDNIWEEKGYDEAKMLEILIATKKGVIPTETTPFNIL